MHIFNYQDYRHYLRDYLGALPKKGRGEINRLATAMNVHPSLVSQVLSGTKNLSLEQGQLCSEYLAHTRIESDYFLEMIQFQRAGTKKLRDRFEERMQDLRRNATEVKNRVRQDKDLSDEAKAIFYSHWLYPAVWLRTSLVQGQTPDEICDALSIQRHRCTEILLFLSSIGLCESREGRFFMAHRSIHLDRVSPFVSRHHTNWRLKAIDASDKIEDDELMYTAPISISKSDLKKIRARLVELIREVTDLAIHSEAQEVVCFNIDFFRLRK